MRACACVRACVRVCVPAFHLIGVACRRQSQSLEIYQLLISTAVKLVYKTVEALNVQNISNQTNSGTV